MGKKLTTIMTIAGSDSSAGAGIQADIKAAAMCGVYAMTVITAVTAQSTSKVRHVHYLSPDVVASQLEADMADGMPDAIKIGMVGSLRNAKTIERYLKTSLSGIPVVIDPVIGATSGNLFSSDIDSLLSFYVEHLLPLATIVTPNMHEASLLLGEPTTISNIEEQKEICLRLLDKLGCKAVILKGGHSLNHLASDILAERGEQGNVFSLNESPRVDCPNLHGTGCTFSTASACALAKGGTIRDSFFAASEMTKALISRSCGYEYGHSNNGPLNHFNFLTK